jgi:Uma2 family endonuclease
MRIDQHHHYRGRRARFAALREHGLNEIVEILHGEPHKRPWGDYTQWIMSDLIRAFELTRRRGSDPSWYRTVRPEIHVRDHVVVPDFAGWYRRRVRCTHRRPFCDFSGERYVHVPDWICDIVEPTHADLVRTQKPAVYLELGVAHLWLLDPFHHRLEVYAASNGGWQLTASYEGRHTVQAAPLEHLKIELGQLWPNPDEFAAAEGEALASISEHLDDRITAGVSECSLLRLLLEECASVFGTSESFGDMRSDHVLLRALTLISRRVPLSQALRLARLEIAAEREARKTMTRDEARKMFDDHLSQELTASIAEAEAGHVISAKESLAQLFDAQKHARIAERADSQPHRDRLDELARQFHSHGTLYEELEQQALDGPYTHTIPFEYWPDIAREAGKRLALPYHDVELCKRAQVLLELNAED